MTEIIYGIVSGIVTSLGCGGGTVLIFLLTYLNGIEQHIAQGINLIFFIPTCIISIILNIKNKNIDFKIAFWISIFGTVGAIIGSEISKKIDVKNLKKLFGIFLILIAVFEIFSLIKMYTKNIKDIENKTNII